MRFPETNSRGEQILKAFLAKGPMTIWQGAEQHGDFPTKRMPAGVDHNKMTELYCDLVERGCLVRDGILYRITLQARHRLEQKLAPATPLDIVPPRVRNFVERTFSLCSPRSPWRIAL